MKKEAKTNLKIILSMLVLLVMMVSVVNAWFIFFRAPTDGQNISGDALRTATLNVSVNSSANSDWLNLTNITYYYKRAGLTSWTEIGVNLTTSKNDTDVAGQILNFSFIWSLPYINATIDINATVINRSTGHSNSTTIQVSMDTIAPVVSVSGLPTNTTEVVSRDRKSSYFSNTTSLSFNYSITDINADMCWLEANFSGSYGKVNVTIEGNNSVANFNPAQDTSLAFNYTLPNVTSVNSATFLWAIGCNDTHSNYNWSMNYSLTIDLTDPVVNITALANNTNLTTANAQFNFSVNLSETNLDTCILYGNFTGTGAIIKNETSYNATPGGIISLNVTLTDGFYIWTAWCNDSSGRSAWNTTNRSVLTVDKTAPTITINVPFANNTYNNTNTLTLNWTILDNSSLLKSISYSIDNTGSTTQYSTDYLFANFTGPFTTENVYSVYRIYEVPSGASDTITAIPKTGVLSEGPHRIEVTAEDWFGNLYELIYNFTVDRDAPTVNDTNAANATPVVAQGGVIYINVTWNESNPNTYKVFRNGTLLSPPGIIELANLSEYHRGMGTTKKRLYNTTDLAKSANYILTSDFDAGVSTYKIILNLTTNTTWYGTYNFKVELTDDVGQATNTSTLTVNVTDNSAPKVNITFPHLNGNFTNNNGTVNGNMTIIFDLEDLGTLNMSTVEIELNTSINPQKFNFTEINFSYTGDCGLTSNLVLTAHCTVTLNVTKNVNTDGLQDGNYTLNISVKDIGGNKNSTLVWFYVDTVIPSAPLAVVTANASGHVYINWTVMGDVVKNTTLFEIWRNNTALGSGTAQSLAASGFAVVKNVSLASLVLSNLNYEDPGTINGVEYYYKIKYFDGAGNYNWSNPVGITATDIRTPRPPVGLWTSCSGATATLYWSAVTQDNTSQNDSVSMRYRVYYLQNTTTYPINSSKGTIITANTTAWNIQEANFSTSGVLADGTNSTTVSVTSTATWFFALSSIDDAGNENLTLNATASGNFGNCSLTYTAAATSSSSSSSSSSGGGGGVAAPAPTNTVATISHMWTAVAVGESVSMTITNANIGVTEVSVTVKNAVVSVSVKVASLKEKPAAVTQAAAQVYQYLEVTPKNIAEGDIDKATIKFKVTKSWLAEKGVAEKEVVLYRQADNKWNKLTTKVVSSDADNVYYEAETPGFSYFAIGTEAAPAPAAAEEAAAEAAAEEGAAAAEAGTTTPPATTVPPASKAWIGWLIAVIAVIGIIVYLVTKKKK